MTKEELSGKFDAIYCIPGVPNTHTFLEAFDFWKMALYNLGCISKEASQHNYVGRRVN